MSTTNVITLVFFPGIFFPACALATSLVDFAVSSLMLVAMLLFYGILPPIQVLLLPLFVLLSLISAAGIGAWVSALGVKYRDFLLAVPFIMQLGMYVSPVAFNSSIIPERWRLLYSLNPLVGVIDGFRWCLLGTPMPGSALDYALSIMIAALLAVTGVRYFRRTERGFADVI